MRNRILIYHLLSNRSLPCVNYRVNRSTLSPTRETVNSIRTSNPILTLASSVVSIVTNRRFFFSTVLSRFHDFEQPTPLCSQRRNATLTLLPGLLANNAFVSRFSATPLFLLPTAAISCIFCISSACCQPLGDGTYQNNENS